MGSPCVSMSVSMCSTNGFRWTQVPNPITCSIKPGTAPGRSPKFQILGLKMCKDWRMMRIHPNYGHLNGFVGEFDPFFGWFRQQFGTKPDLRDETMCFSRSRSASNCLILNPRTNMSSKDPLRWQPTTFSNKMACILCRKNQLAKPPNIVYTGNS